MYVPDTKKWLKFYEDLVTKGRDNEDRSTHARSGSIAQQPTTVMEAIDTRHNLHKSKKKSEELTVDLVSPIQLNVDQAKEELKRDRMIKRKKYVKQSRAKGKRIRKRKGDQKHRKLQRLRKKKKKGKRRQRDILD